MCKSATFCFEKEAQHIHDIGFTKKATRISKSLRMSNRVSDWGRVLLVLLLAGIGSCAPRGKGGGARGGTVANKAVVGEITHDVNKSRCRAVPLERNSCGQNAIENVLRTVLWIIEHGGTPVSGSRNIEIYGTQHLISVSSSNHLKRNTKTQSSNFFQ